MTPEQLAASGTESGHQRALFSMAASQMYRFPELKWMHHIPNGGARSAASGAKMKGDGVKAGVFDIFVPVARAGFHGFYIEMKAPGKLTQVSDKQKEFLEFVTEQNYAFGVYDNWRAAWSDLETYMEAPAT